MLQKPKRIRAVVETAEKKKGRYGQVHLYLFMKNQGVKRYKVIFFQFAGNPI